jgi:hypothetical protein
MVLLNVIKIEDKKRDCLSNNEWNALSPQLPLKGHKEEN